MPKHDIKISRHPSAERDIDDIAFWIASENTEAGKRFLSSVEQAVDLLMSSPEVGPRYQTEIPKLQKVRFYPIPFPNRGRNRPYLIFYTEEENHLRILYVFHGARDILDRMKDDIRE